MNVFARSYAFSVGEPYPAAPYDGLELGRGFECTLGGKNNKIQLIEVTKRNRYFDGSMNDLSYLCHALRVLFQLLLQRPHPVGFLAK